MQKWPLNVSNFTLLDKLKICKFFLSPSNFWTMNKQTEKFEKTVARYVGVNHAVFVSSGSTANTILAMYLKDKVYTPEKKIIVVPSVTWTTAVAPFVREGFEPYFIDINQSDLSLNLTRLTKYLETNSDKVAAVFVTSLLGFVPDISQLKAIQTLYKVPVFLDNCESTLSRFCKKNISSCFTSTTSTYFGHQIQSVEGGFLFTNDRKEYEYFLLARNHGMVRSLKSEVVISKYRNSDVNPLFDFNIIGNNFRNSDINAFIGQLDFKRADYYAKIRKKIYKKFYDVSHRNVTIPKIREGLYDDIPFSIPMIFKNDFHLKSVKNYCLVNHIETRPILSGNLLRQTCYNKYGEPTNEDLARKYPISENIHKNGIYIGLHPKIKNKQIKQFIEFLNNLQVVHA